MSFKPIKIYQIMTKSFVEQIEYGWQMALQAINERDVLKLFRASLYLKKLDKLSTIDYKAKDE